MTGRWADGDGDNFFESLGTMHAPVGRCISCLCFVLLGFLLFVFSTPMDEGNRLRSALWVCFPGTDGV